MDLNDLFDDATEAELSELDDELGASVFGLKLPNVSAKVSGTLTLSKAIARAKAAGASSSDIAKLRRASPKNIARVAKMSKRQIQALMKLGKKKKRKTKKRKTKKRKKRTLKLKKPGARVLRVAKVLKRAPISATCPSAYRQLACTSGVGGGAGLALLKHIKSQVDLANTRALATSEHNALNNTSAFRRAVLKGLRQRQRACR